MKPLADHFLAYVLSSCPKPANAPMASPVEVDRYVREEMAATKFPREHTVTDRGEFSILAATKSLG